MLDTTRRADDRRIEKARQQRAALEDVQAHAKAVTLSMQQIWHHDFMSDGPWREEVLHDAALNWVALEGSLGLFTAKSRVADPEIRRIAESLLGLYDEMLEAETIERSTEIHKSGVEVGSDLVTRAGEAFQATFDA